MINRLMALLAVLAFVLVSGWTYPETGRLQPESHHVALGHHAIAGAHGPRFDFCQPQEDCGSVSAATCAVACLGLMHFAASNPVGHGREFDYAGYGIRNGPAVMPVHPGTDERPPKLRLL